MITPITARQQPIPRAVETGSTNHGMGGLGQAGQEVLTHHLLLRSPAQIFRDTALERWLLH